jgi:arylsulfatase A-like enzyme
MLRSLFLAAYLCLATSHSVSVASQPNILFLFADDLCFEAIGAMGNKEVQTPNLDRLASRGMLFTHAYNMGSWHGAVCMPSRGMLNTGRFLWDFQKVDNQIPKEQSAGRLWSEYLRAAGYHTYMSGKWHVKLDAAKAFDQVGTVRAGMPKDTPAGYNRPFADSPDPWSPSDPKFGGFWEGGKHWSEVLADEAITYLSSTTQRQNKPFFMYVAFNAPHDPRQAPQEYLDRYPLNKIAIPENFLPDYPFKNDIGLKNMRDENLAPFPRTKHAIQVHRREYYAIITHLDNQIGRVLEALDKAGQSENTWIFFSADHGLAVGQHGLVGKQNLFDHSIRPPFIVAGPDVQAGSRTSEPIYYQDVMPTTLELAGVKKPEHVQFQSLLPIIRREGKSKYSSIYNAYINYQRSVTQQGWKLILYPDIKKTLLFDLTNDPKEIKDLSADPAHATRIRSLFQELVRWQKETGDSLDLKSKYPDML